LEVEGNHEILCTLKLNSRTEISAIAHQDYSRFPATQRKLAAWSPFVV